MALHQGRPAEVPAASGLQVWNADCVLWLGDVVGLAE